MDNIIDMAASAKKLANKYILSDGTELRLMPDAEFYALEEKFFLESARRFYSAANPEETSFRSFCARVKREFINKLVPSQQETIEQLCHWASVKPIPTLDEYVQKVRERLWQERQFSAQFGTPQTLYLPQDFVLRPRIWRGELSSKDIGLVRIWGRIRNDWGSVEANTFEHDLERNFQREVFGR
jgi:hypothetical protein